MQRRTGLIAATLVGAGLWLVLSPGMRSTTADLDPDLLAGALRARGTTVEGWHSLGGAHTDQARVTVTVTPTGSFELELTLPGFQLTDLEVAGRLCSRIDVPGLIKHQDRGRPELPVASTSLALADPGAVRFRIVERIEREYAVNPIEPSKGYLPRNIDPASVVAQFGSFYDEGGVWPREPVVLGNPFQLRDQSGVNVRLNPLRFDAGRGRLMVTERLVVEVIAAGGAAKRESAGSSAFGAVRNALFGDSLPASSDKYQTVATSGRMLVIVPEALAEEVQPFVAWKRQRGITTDIAVVPDFGVTSDAIAGLITAAYDEVTGLTWVVLVGDREQIPPMAGQYDGSDSDTRYAMVSGDDIYPDLFVSRISADTKAQVATQVNKFIAYEKSPSTGFASAWYSRAAAVASDEGTPSDAERAEALRADLASYGYDPIDRIYQNQGGTTDQIKSTLTAGVSLINYIGHGTGTSWESVPFSDGDLADLRNGARLPWIIDVSCYNGDIARESCFAEAWLRAGTPESPAGAVGMIAASSLAPWVPPTIMQAEVVDLLTNGEAWTMGALYYSGLMRVADLYGGLPVAVRVVEQNIIFGDCSLQVRTRAPAEFIVDCPETAPAGAGTLDIQVAGPPGAVVALTNDGDLYGSVVLGDGGAVQIPLGSWAEALPAVDVTITGFNMVPWQGTVALTSEGLLSAVEQTRTPDRVTLIGNYPNPFNPSTRIGFVLPDESGVVLHVYDIRGRLVRDLSVARKPAGIQEIIWDGRDDRGQGVPSGVYLYRLEAAGENLSGRMTLSK